MSPTTRLLKLNGATYNPRVGTLRQIAGTLDVSIDDLMKE